MNYPIESYRPDRFDTFEEWKGFLDNVTADEILDNCVCSHLCKNFHMIESLDILIENLEDEQNNKFKGLV